MCYVTQSTYLLWPCSLYSYNKLILWSLDCINTLIKYLNLQWSSGDILVYNILINMHISNLPFKSVISTWLCWATILSSCDYFILFWMHEIQLLHGVILNWIVLHVVPNFLLDSCLTENIFKNYTESAIDVT